MSMDTSREIYSQYFGRSGRYVCVMLKDRRILTGKFIGFFQGDEESGEPFIRRWHFLQKGQESPLNSTIFPTQEEGIYLEPENIESIQFDN